MKTTYPATRLNTFTGGITQMTNGGKTKRKETFFCLLQAAGPDPDTLTKILSDFRYTLGDKDIAGDYFGTRRAVLEDVASGFLKHTELSCHIAMLLIYADETSMPTVRNLYKAWNTSLERIPKKE